MSAGSKLCPCGSETATAGLGHTLTPQHPEEEKKPFPGVSRGDLLGEGILIDLSWPLRPLLGTCLYGPVVMNLPASAGDMGSVPGLGRPHVLRSNYARAPQQLSPNA